MSFKSLLDRSPWLNDSSFRFLFGLLVTLWQFHIALEHDPFVEHLSMKYGNFPCEIPHFGGLDPSIPWKAGVGGLDPGPAQP